MGVLVSRINSLAHHLLDNGNAIVVIDKLEYSNELVDIVKDGSFSKVKKDPTLKTKS